jgi:DNA-directed RNA polymerase subunit L
MDEKFDLEIKRAEESSDVYKGTKLILTMYGTDVTFYLVNTLRQVIYREIPVYAFAKSEINIDKNTSIFDNNYMRIRLAMLPIPKVKCDIEYLEPIYYPYVAGATDTLKPEHPGKYHKSEEDDNDISFHLNIKNDSEEILNVMTNELKMMVKGKEIKNLYDRDMPPLIIKLRKDQEFIFSMKAVLGIAKLHDCWAAVSQVYYGKMDFNKYVFVLKSLGQKTEWEIMTVACNVLIIKFIKLKKNLSEQFNDKELDELTAIIILIEKEGHMVGNLLACTLYKHPKITYSGYKIDHPYEQAVTLKLVTKDKYSVTRALLEGIDNIIALFETVKVKLEKAEKEKFTPNKRIIEIKRVIGNDYQLHPELPKKLEKKLAKKKVKK